MVLGGGRGVCDVPALRSPHAPHLLTWVKAAARDNKAGVGGGGVRGVAAAQSALRW